ncbi:MAG: 3-phosphoshikimate 1-carboxyvinyltransferase [Acidimicrobiales bacterium]
MSATYAVRPLDSPPDTTVVLPGSKSLTNRALLCAALAEGESTLVGALHADDTEAMMDGLGRLGARIRSGPDDSTVVVAGVGGSLPGHPVVLDARLSGTTSRFLLATLGAGSAPFTLDGAPPLRARPMADGIAALRRLGIDVVERGEPGHLPLTVQGPPRTSSTQVPGDVSSQFLSGLLLAAPSYPEGLDIEVATPLVSAPYVEMTVSVMRSFGAAVSRPAAERFRVEPGGYRATTYAIEPDASAASYFFAAAAICRGRVRVPGLRRSSLQGDIRFLDVLAEMGATVTWYDGGVEVSADRPLRGVTVDLRDLSDTAQTLAVTAVFATSPTEITGIGFIRAKETDRIAAVVRELQRVGVEARETDDGLVISPGTPHPAVIQTYDDHRMAMSFALLGLRAPGIEIADPGCVAKTFPRYFEVLEQLRGGSGAAGSVAGR